MKFLKTFLTCLAIATVLPFQSAHAADPYDLNALDVLGTCKEPVQIRNAKNALSFLSAFVTWHVGDQVRTLDPEFMGFHSSLAGVLVSNPGLRGKVPFDKGQWGPDKYIETMAFLAYHNDIDDYEVAPSRVDCFGSKRVILTTDFKGVQLARDKATGCITHREPFGAGTKIAVEIKEYVDEATKETYGLVLSSESYLDNETSVAVRERLAERVRTEPALTPVKATCQTMDMIVQKFSAQ